MNRRLYGQPGSQPKFLRHALEGDIVEGMARKPLFSGKNGHVMAVTWPFHDREALLDVEAVLSGLGYETHIHKRSDYDGVYELIIGHRRPRKTDHASSQGT